MVFKVETHAHTSEVSGCGRIPGADLAALYADAGFDAIVIADHYYEGFFAKAPELDWRGQMDRYLRGFREAHRAGERLGLRVFLGVELLLASGPNDFLLFGLNEETLLAEERLHLRSLPEIRALADRLGAALFGAHPFRPRMLPLDPAVVHGVEVMNGHPNHPSDNPRALAFARQHGLRMTAGSDAHFLEGAARAWMEFGREIRDGADLASALLGREKAALVGPDGFRLEVNGAGA